jgi:hypothetical protein
MSKAGTWFKLFGGQLMVILLVVGVLHAAVLWFFNQPDYLPLLVGGYAVNLIFTFGIMAALYELQEKYVSQLGFIFMGTSLFKIVTFFCLLLLYKPTFLSTESLNTTEAIVFFVPYGVSMVFETFKLIGFLNLK